MVENDVDFHTLRKDIHESHSNARVAQIISWLALIAGIIGIGLGMWGVISAAQAQNDANRANDQVEQLRNEQ